MRRWLVPSVVLVVVLAGFPVGAAVPVTEVVYVWESGGMTDETYDELAEIVDEQGLAMAPNHRGTLKLLSVTRDDEIVQQATPGYVIPMAALALDPDASLPLVGSRITQALHRGDVVMGESSAQLRGAQVGDVVEFIGWNDQTVRSTIGAIAPDDRVGSNELIFSVETAATFGFERLSSVNIWGFTNADALAVDLIVRFIDKSVGVDADPDRSVDAVLTNVALKRQFGEFSYRFTGPGDKIQIDPAWVEANIVDVNLPLLGPFKCHRSMVPYLESAMDEVIASGLGDVVDSADFQLAGGCYNARLIRGGDKGGAISRHSWGVAVDINPSTNRYGGDINMDARFADIFHRWGFAWGGGWVFSDGAHFEWTRLPDAIVDT